MLHTTNLPHLQCALLISPRSLYYGKFSVDQEHLHVQMRCFTVFYLFSWSSFAFDLSLSSFSFWFCLYCSSTGLKIFSKPAYSINGTFYWYEISIMKFQTFFFLRCHLDINVTIAASVLIVLISWWCYAKAIETIHAKVICSFMCCVQRLKKPWKILDCRATSIFFIYYHQQVSLLATLSMTLWSVSCMYTISTAK